MVGFDGRPWTPQSALALMPERLVAVLPCVLVLEALSC